MAKLPKRYERFLEKYPEIARAYHSLGEATAQAGPLDEKARSLAKLAIAIGARQEGAVRSHARRSIEAGATVDEIRHVALLATTTIGFPNMMAALSWIEKVLEESEA
ncbi:MAG: carboxymuconolactone decarboxylase family protein [Fimbriimonadaceae bacterium]|nr:carboxymuconolactone decarboxylase family protein [Fimbriimonadaceae bacterium]